MKQRWIFNIFGITLVLLCFSCTGFFEIEGEESIEPYNNPAAVPTLVVFNNLNSCSVDVFSSPYRDKAIISVSGNNKSNSLSWVGTDADGYNFYLAYNFTIEGCKIPYIPPMDNNANFVNVRINRGQTNTVNIPPLGNYISKDLRLSNDIWLIIKNTGYSQLRLINTSGTSILNENNETTVNVNGGTGLYKLDANASPSSYKIRAGAADISLPLTIFDPGSIHVITTNGITATLTKTTELTLNNLTN